MSSDVIRSSKRVLDPADRIAEVLFGLIMVLTFTGSLGVAEAGREELGRCSLAPWDAIWRGASSTGSCISWGAWPRRPEASRSSRPCAMPPISSRRTASSRRRCHRDGVRAATGRARGAAPALEATARAARPRTPGQGRLAGSHGRVSSRLPLHVPGSDPVHRDAQCRARLARFDAIAIAMLFIAGHAYGRIAGYHPWMLGIAMVLLGGLLSTLTH